MLELLIEGINTSRLFNGFSTLAMYIGGKYLTAEIPSNVEKAFNSTFFRRLFIFFIMFLAFRDIRLAIIITLIFLIIFNYLLDEKSRVFVGKFIGLKNEKQDEVKSITAEDVEKAKNVIKFYNNSLEEKKIKTWELR